MKKKKLIAIFLMLFGIIILVGAFILLTDDEDGAVPSSPTTGTQEGVYYDPSSPEVTQINLLEKMQKLKYLYKDIEVIEAYIYASPGVNVFSGYFVNSSGKKLTNYNMTFVFYDKNNREIYRFTDQNLEVGVDEKVMLRAETNTFLGNVDHFKIIDV